MASQRATSFFPARPPETRVPDVITYAGSRRRLGSKFYGLNDRWLKKLLTPPTALQYETAAKN